MKYAADGVMSFGKTFSSSNLSVQLEMFQLCTLKNYVSTRDRVVWRSAYGHAVTKRSRTAMLSRRFFFCAPRMGRTCDGYTLRWNQDKQLLVFPNLQCCVSARVRTSGLVALSPGCVGSRVDLEECLR